MTRNITQFPNTQYTANTAEVYTATGFNVGDLVYYQNGDYKNTSNLTQPSTVQFNNSQTLGLTNLNSSGTIGSVIGSTAAYTAAQGGGCSVLKSAAVLTSGNIVQVYVAASSGPTGRTSAGVYFQIVNTSGVIQYGPILVSSSIVPTTIGGAGVLALTGGGFVIYYSNASGNAVYGIYTNTGTVTTAVAADTGITTVSTGYMNGTALANGGFALVALTNASTVAFRAYGATGTATYGWTITGTNSVGTTVAVPGIAARSDSSIAISYVGASNINYCFLYTSAGAVITSVNYTTAGNITTNMFPTDITCLADGTTYVIGYYNNTAASYFYPAFRLLPTGNTLGSEIAIPYQNLQYYTSAAAGLNFISLQKQSAGGFMFVFTDAMGGIQYAFFNVSGTALSGTNANGTLPILLQGYVGLKSILTTVEITGYMNLYWSSAPQFNTLAYGNFNQNYAQINTTTYQPVPIASTTQTIGTVTSTPGSVVLSTATPTSSKVYAGSTTSVSATLAAGVVVAPTVIYNTHTSYSCSSCTLPNGQFLVAYMDSTTTVVYVAVYSIFGVLQQTITVGTSTGNGTTIGGVKIAALSSGKFVVGWPNPGNNSLVNLSLYSSSFTLINTSSAAVTLASPITASVNYALTGLAGTDKYAVVFVDISNNLSWTAYDNTNTIIGSPVVVASGTWMSVSIAADNSGGFGISGIVAATQKLFTYVPTSSTTWTATATNTTFPSNTAGPTYLSFSNNRYYGLATNGTSVATVATSNGYNTYNVPYGTDSSTGSYYGLGINGNGGLVQIATDTLPATLTYVFAVLPGITYTNGNIITNNGNTNRSTLTPTPTAYSSFGYFQYNIIPSYANNVVITWINSSGYPSFCIYNSLAYTTTTSLTAGVTPSANPISIYPTTLTTNASTSVNGATLAGVALTTASAGSTAQIQINGLAQLGSAYTSTATGAFDFTGQAVAGVKGIYNGKIINLQGNS